MWVAVYMVVTSQLSINDINLTNIYFCRKNLLMRQESCFMVEFGFSFLFFSFCLKGNFPHFFAVSSLRLSGVVSWCFGLVQSRNDVIHKKRKKIEETLNDT